MNEFGVGLEFEDATRVRDETKRLEEGEFLSTGGGVAASRDYKPWKPAATREEKRRTAQAKMRGEAERGRGLRFG